MVMCFTFVCLVLVHRSGSFGPVVTRVMSTEDVCNLNKILPSYVALQTNK